MAKERCWVWFRNGLDESGTWNSGWYGESAKRGGIRIENPSYVPCRVPEWRVAWKEPKDVSTPPEIPEGAEWKLYPLE